MVMCRSHLQVKRAGAAIVLAGAAQLSHAQALSYFVSFTGGATLPDVGLFTYNAASSTFDNFQVLWNGHVYDLTGAANAPVVGTACPGTGVSGATGFALLSKSMCAGLYDRWFGTSSFGSTNFSFSSQTLALPERSAARIATDGPAVPGAIGFDVSGGDWSLGAPFLATGGTPALLPGGLVVFPGGGVYIKGLGLVPINYRISFSGGSDLPNIGVFNYDKSTSTFSNFYVQWQGVTFDLTSAANSPSVGTACLGTAANAATTFALLSKSMCAGLYDRWFGTSSFGSTNFSFSSQTLALPELNAARISADGPGLPGALGFDVSGGDWSISPIAVVPEASRAGSLALGLLVLGGTMAGRRRQARQEVLSRYAGPDNRGMADKP